MYMAWQGLKVTAIDYLPPHVEAAERRVERQGLQKQITVRHMDYHHLETIPDESHDAVYTLETFVHASDPEAVLAGFYRILKPGGKLVLLEYDNQLHNPQLPKHIRDAIEKINHYAAMPTNTRSCPGFYDGIMEGTGFVDIKVTDVTENIRPMLFLFWVLASVPYFLVRLFHLEEHFINTVAGAKAYLGTEYWRYVKVEARKPETLTDMEKEKE
ncbi:S-adenosyl-L-methionine-dependent methyltransferase [Coniochaeta sp. 2T2.1]|nr:S-adenosyl-L-methionine-dependent methyltransferase [Coniochaeta sp. 2T2.1]